MTNFVEFSQTRKQLIARQRERLMTERPERDVYGTVHRALGVADYAVYAALRGAYYGKGDHTGGRVAAHALRSVINDIVYWSSSTGRYGQELCKKYMPEGTPPTSETWMEFKAILESELEKWT